jgi:hypothetical protein
MGDQSQLLNRNILHRPANPRPLIGIYRIVRTIPAPINFLGLWFYRMAARMYYHIVIIIFMTSMLLHRPDADLIVLMLI